MKTSPYGLLAFLHWNHEWNNWHFPNGMLSRAAKQIKELGVGMVRVDIVWSDVHRGFHKYDYSDYDNLIARLKEQGLELLVLLHYNKDHKDKSGNEVWSTPPDPQEFAAYVDATVSRYKNQVKHWEIWNEPNHPVYWSKPRDEMRTYVELLKSAYAAAKRADPSCFVINGGITEPVIEDVQNFYAAGGKDLTDALTIHTFLDPAIPDVGKKFDEIIDGVQKVKERFGDGKKKIWITEMGCPGVPAAITDVKNWWAGNNLTEKQQADWLEKQFGFMKKHPVIEKMFWAFYRDTDGIFKDGVDYFGLVRFDLTPKPAFDRFQRLITSAR